jgi:hypothetical protein
VVDVTSVNTRAPEQITDGSQLARNLGALAEILLFAEGKNLILMVDEAERLREIRRGDPYNLWLEALREIFRRPTLGMLMFFIAEGRDDIPELLYEEEVMSSIGSTNVWESAGFGVASADSFLRDLLTQVIQRDPCPLGLATLLGETGESLETYPLTAEAFDEFVNYHSRPPANRPREMLNNLEAVARRAIFRNKPLVDMTVLREILEGV